MYKPRTLTVMLLFALTIVLFGCMPTKDGLSIEDISEAKSVVPIIEVIDQTLPYEPVDIAYQSGQITKSFVVPLETDLYTLTEAPFTEGDHVYHVSAIERQTIPGDIETKTVTQTIPVEVPNNNQAEALAWYSPELDYNDEEGFVGRVSLQPETLTVTANGTKSYTYQITDSRQYFNLIRNDPSAIPQTTTKGGRTLELVNIDWQIADQTMAGDSLIATRYNAIAHYATKAQGSRVTGYTAKATYVGEVSRQGEEKVRCAIIYTGELTPKGLAKRLIVPFLIVALALALLLPPQLRRRQLRQLTAQSALTERSPNATVSPTAQEADVPPKSSRLKSWWQKRNHSPIFVELIDSEDEDAPAKAKRIYLPKETQEKGEDDDET